MPTNTQMACIQLPLSQRPLATTVPAGTVFKATDGGTYLCALISNVRTWVGFSDGSTGVGANQVAIGAATGGGLTGSSQFTFDGSDLNLLGVDTNPFLNIDTRSANPGGRVATFSDGGEEVLTVIANRTSNARGVYITGYEGDPLVSILGRDPTSSPPNTRSFEVINDDEAPAFQIIAKTTAQKLSYCEEQGVPQFVYLCSNNTSTWYNNDGLIIDANRILQITHDVNNPKLDALVPLTFPSYTVGALPTPPFGGVGSVAWASNGRKTGEGGGAGTGVLVAYSSGGPAGAGWYPVGLTATLVTA